MTDQKGGICYERIQWLPLKKPIPLVWKRHQEATFPVVAQVDFQTPPEDLWRLILDWAMGSGKTLTALMLLLKALRAPKRVLIITSKSVCTHWEEEMKRLSPPFPISVTLINLVNLKEHPDDLARADVVIADECHMFKNDNASVDLVLEQLSRVPYMILLSGTLVKNDRNDLKGLCRLMHSQYDPLWTDEVCYKHIKALCQGKISYFNPLEHTVDALEHYPTVKREVVKITFPVSFYPGYWKLSGFQYIPGLGDSKHRFGTQGGVMAQRKYFMPTSGQDNPKFQWVVQKLKEGTLKTPLLLYSNYVTDGGKPLKAYLQKEFPHYKMELVDGQTPTLERSRIFRQFNKGKLPLLFFSRAVSEGVDLKGAHSVVLLDPQEPLADEEQTIARAVRLYSHPVGAEVVIYHLISQFVDVYQHKWQAGDYKALREAYLQLCPSWRPEEREAISKASDEELKNAIWRSAAEHKTQTVEEIIYERAREKHRALQPLLKVLRSCSIQMPRGDTMSLPKLSKRLQQLGLKHTAWGLEPGPSWDVKAVQQWCQELTQALEKDGVYVESEALCQYMIQNKQFQWLEEAHPVQQAPKRQAWWSRVHQSLPEELKTPLPRAFNPQTYMRWLPRHKNVSKAQLLWEKLHTTQTLPPRGATWTAAQIKAATKVKGPELASTVSAPPMKQRKQQQSRQNKKSQKKQTQKTVSQPQDDVPIAKPPAQRASGGLVRPVSATAATGSDQPARAPPSDKSKERKKATGGAAGGQKIQKGVTSGRFIQTTSSSSSTKPDVISLKVDVPTTRYAEMTQYQQALTKIRPDIHLEVTKKQGIKDLVLSNPQYKKKQNFSGTTGIMALYEQVKNYPATVMST